jgi:hypothetical protein
MFIRQTEETIQKLLAEITRKTQWYECPVVYYFPESGTPADGQVIIKARLIKRINEKIVAIRPTDRIYPVAGRSDDLRRIRRVDFRKLHCFGLPPLPGPIPGALSGPAPSRLLAVVDQDFSAHVKRIIDNDYYGLSIDIDAEKGEWLFASCYGIVTDNFESFFIITKPGLALPELRFIDLPFKRTIAITELLAGRGRDLHYVRWLSPNHYPFLENNAP